MLNKKNSVMVLAAVAVLAAGALALAGCVDAWVRMPVPPMGFSTIPAGSFTRGSGGGAHQVTLTKTFYMSDHEVTQGEWRAVVGNDGYDTTDKPSDTYGKGDNFPMYYVSWYDSLVFCNKLSLVEGKTPCYKIKDSTNPADWGTPPSSYNDTDWDNAVCDWTANGYRLPTEAEWQYAAMGGSGTPYTKYSGTTGTDESDLQEVAWYSANSDEKTHEVNTKPNNANPIKDMSGNVGEWCWDWNSSYRTGQTTDPTGSGYGVYRVNRGVSWDGSSASYCTVSYRKQDDYPGIRSSDVGFRVVCRP